MVTAGAGASWREAGSANHAKTSRPHVLKLKTPKTKANANLSAPPGGNEQPTGGGATVAAATHAGGGNHRRDRRSALKIGTFNVRTLGTYQGREGLSVEQEALLRDLEEKMLDIILIQECRIAEWLVAERWRKYVVFGGGATKNAAGAKVHGVLILVREDIEVIDTSHNENGRMVRVTVRGEYGKKLHFLSVYAPTEPSKKAEKKRFYELVQGELKGIKAYDEVIIGGDWNAELGAAQTELIEADLPYTVGRCGLSPGFSIQSENARMMADFCGANQLLDVSSLCKKQWGKRWTFCGNFQGGRKKREYDHFLVRYRDRGLAKEYAVASGTRVESDHRLVTMKLESAARTKPRKIVEHKKEERTKEFAQHVDTKIRERFSEQEQERMEENSTAPEIWKRFEEEARRVLAEYQGEKGGERKKRKEWIGEAAWKMIEQRRRLAAHGKATVAERNALRRRIKQAVNGDKKKWIEEKVQEIRQADAGGNTKVVYEAVRRLAGRARKPPQELPGGEQRHKDFWTEVLGTERPEAPTELRATETWRRCEKKMVERSPGEGAQWVEEACAQEPGDKEINAAIDGLKKKKSCAGLLPAEFYQGSEVGRRVLRAVVKKIFAGEEIPESWLEAEIALLHKAGPKAQPGNWRPVALLTVGEKLLGLVILNRIKQAAYKEVDKRQKGSVKGLSCRHAVFRLLRDMERVEREGEEAIYTFVDFRKAYDSVDWSRMPQILLKLGMPPHIVKVVQATNAGARFRLKLGGDKLSGPIKQKSGIRQGSSLSPLEFVLLLGFAMGCFAETMEKRGWKEEKSAEFGVTWLGFVDDLVVKSKDAAEAREALKELMAACRFVGLEVNVAKTELMTFGLCPKTCNNEDATRERFHQHGDESKQGWMVEYDGAHLREEWKESTKNLQWKEESKPTHLLVWDGGERNIVRYTEKGWATTERGAKLRLVRLGQKQYVVEGRNKFVCERCGDVLPDGKALKYHQATGFCRPVKTLEQQRQLRVGRYLEEKAKATERKKLLVPIDLQTYSGEKIGTAAAFKYLGTQVSNSASTSAEVARRTGIARTTVRTLRDLWRDATVPRHLKAELYGALVTSVALYNSECWVIPESDWKVLRAFQLATLKVITGEDRRRWHHRQGQDEDTEEEEDERKAEEAEEAAGEEINEDDEEQEWTSRRSLCERTGIVDIETLVREKRVAWAAHAARDHSGEGVFRWIANELRRKTVWGRQLHADLAAYGLQIDILGTMDAKELRQLMHGRREIEAAKRAKKGRKGGKKREKSEKTEEKYEEQRKRIAEQKEERRKQKEKEKELLRRINNHKWVRAPGAGVGSWRLADSEDLTFKVSHEDFCENTGRDRFTVAGVVFHKNRDGRFKCDHEIEDAHTGF
eukprot:g19784.t1